MGETMALVTRNLVRPVVFDDVPEVVLCVIEQKPHLPVRVVQKNSLQGDNIRVLETVENRRHFIPGRQFLKEQNCVVSSYSHKKIQVKIQLLSLRITEKMTFFCKSLKIFR